MHYNAIVTVNIGTVTVNIGIVTVNNDDVTIGNRIESSNFCKSR